MNKTNSAGEDPSEALCIKCGHRRWLSEPSGLCQHIVDDPVTCDCKCEFSSAGEDTQVAQRLAEIRSQQAARSKRFNAFLPLHRDEQRNMLTAVDYLLSLVDTARPPTSYNAVCPVCESPFGFTEPEPLDTLYRKWETAIRRECREREATARPQATADGAATAQQIVNRIRALTPPPTVTPQSETVDRKLFARITQALEFMRKQAHDAERHPANYPECCMDNLLPFGCANLGTLLDECAAAIRAVTPIEEQDSTKI